MEGTTLAWAVASLAQLILGALFCCLHLGIFRSSRDELTGRLARDRLSCALLAGTPASQLVTIAVFDEASQIVLMGLYILGSGVFFLLAVGRVQIPTLARQPDDGPKEADLLCGLDSSDLESMRKLRLISEEDIQFAENMIKGESSD